MDNPEIPEADRSRNPDQLTGWKEIAGYLGKAVRTVQRWERQAGLPVHRVQRLGDVVYAFRSELDRWRDTSQGSELLQLPPEVPHGEQYDSTRDIAPSRQPVNSLRLILAAGTVIVVVAVLTAYGLYRTRTVFELLSDPITAQAQGKTFLMTVKGFPPTGTVVRWTRLPNGREEAMLPPLAPDQHGEIKWALSTDCQTETGTHALWMIDERSGRRSKVAFVVVLPNPDCDRPLPDLAARVIGLDPVSVRRGERVTVRFTLWNMGNASAVPTLTRVRISTHSTRTAVSDASLGDVRTPALAIGESVTQIGTFTIPADTAAGVYYLWVIADNGSATTEPDSFNNFARSQAFVVTNK
jgi:hypothetical protein